MVENQQKQNQMFLARIDQQRQSPDMDPKQAIIQSEKIVFSPSRPLSQNSTDHTYGMKIVDEQRPTDLSYKPLKLYKYDEEQEYLDQETPIEKINKTRSKPASLQTYIQNNESSFVSPQHSNQKSYTHNSLLNSENETIFKQANNGLMKKEEETEKEMSRDQIYVLNNSTRQLVGQQRNANKKHPSDYPLVINVNYTQYEVLQDCADETDFRLSLDDEEDWDIWWIDGPIIPALLFKMKSYQRTNHLPACYVLARKNLLARNLQNMQKVLPDEYDFFPQTWILPADSKSFKDQFNHKRAKTFIIKPESQC